MNDFRATPKLRVIAIDDDVAQKHVLNASLHSIAEVEFYSEPALALAAITRTKFDAAIIDVHLRRSMEDGFDLARRIHVLDPFLVFTLYTGDDSPAILESALDVHAWKRILKASKKETIIATVRECAVQTQQNRALNRDAGIGRDAREFLVEQLRTVELTRTIADTYRGFFHRMANELTAAGVTGSAFAALVERLSEETVSRAARKQLMEELARTVTSNTETINRLRIAVRQMNSETGDLNDSAGHSRVALALDSARRIFSADARLSEAAVKCIHDEHELVLPIAQLTLLNAIRNTGQFLLDHCGSSDLPELLLTSTLVDRDRAQHLADNPKPLLILNRQFLEQTRFVRIHLRSSTSRLDPQEIESALAGPPQAGCLYSVSALAALLSGTVVFQQTKAGAVVELLFPAWA